MQVDLGDVPGWAAFVAAAAAIVVAIRANRHAKDSAKASTDSALSARRSAEAAERQAAAAEAAVPPPPPPVAWRINKVSRDGYALRNVGTETATGVRVREDPAIIDLEIGDGTVRPGATIAFWAVNSGAGLIPNELWVSWDGQADEVAVPM